MRQKEISHPEKFEAHNDQYKQPTSESSAHEFTVDKICLALLRDPHVFTGLSHDIYAILTSSIDADGDHSTALKDSLSVMLDIGRYGLNSVLLKEKHKKYIADDGSTSAATSVSTIASGSKVPSVGTATTQCLSF